MMFSREIRWLLVVTLSGFGLITLVAAYWATIGPATLLQRPDNPRLFEAEARLMRGSLYDRKGTLLVESVPDDNGFVSRHYLYPAFYSALGYYSQVYGVGGIEAAFDTQLRGADTPANWQTFARESLLHLPREGDDIRLTLDLSLQQGIVERMSMQTGAVVVLHVPTGEVLALVSQPTFDPNTLDASWDDLIADPARPFFNRALQGRYQPGLLMLMPLVSLAHADGLSLDTQFNAATAPLRLGTLTLECLTFPSETLITLREAFIHGCPTPFADLTDILGLSRIESSLERLVAALPALTLAEDPVRAGDVVPVATGRPVETVFALEDVLGQGGLTVSPLAMASWVGAIVNAGNAPEPHVFAGVRAPGDEAWETSVTISTQVPLFTGESASLLRDLLVASVEQGSARAAHMSDLTMGGMTALAYSGDRTLSWFVGFALSPAQEAFAVAVLLENAETTEQAAELGGYALEAASRAYQDNS